MVRSTAKALAGSSTTAAKKVISGSPATKATAGKPAAAKKSVPAKKTAAKKTAAKKTATAAKATPAKKAPPVKKTATTKTAAQTPAPTKKAAPAKKTAGRSAAPRALVVKDGETRWSKAELDEVIADLHEHRDRLTVLLHDQEEDLASLMRDPGDGAGHDQADMGATSFERDQELTVVNNERESLAQIDRALERIEDGTYGVCESCGNPIGKMRLMAFPRATLCMSCKQREERR